jgi:hypothetical protein
MYYEAHEELGKLGKLVIIKKRIETLRCDIQAKQVPHHHYNRDKSRLHAHGFEVLDPMPSTRPCSSAVRETTFTQNLHLATLNPTPYNPEP